MMRPILRDHASLSACAASLLALACIGRADAADCLGEPQGEGRVAAVVDARTLRLEDGREIRLAGIERIRPERPSSRAALSALVAGRDVTLRGEDDTPAVMAVRRPSCSLRARNIRCKRSCCAAAKRWFRPIYLTKTAQPRWLLRKAPRATPNWASGLKPRP